MVRLFVFLAAVQLVLLILALISCLSAERVRALPRALWVVLILLLPILGPVAYFLAGRPVPGGPDGPPARPLGPRPRPRPTSPDDDAEFLRSLDAEQARKDRELLAQWERDLQGRKDDDRADGDGEVRRNEETPPSTEDRPT
jgi:hypothetical protein